MNPSKLVLVAFCSVLSGSVRAETPPASKPAASQFSADDQKLIDRYSSALHDKFGFGKWTFKDGVLIVETSTGPLTVDIKGARSEDDVEERVLKALPGVEKKTAGESKVPVYSVGSTADALFKGAVGAADGKDADPAAKADANDYKALLDLKTGAITFPVSKQPDIKFVVAGKPARRVVLRRAEDGSLSVTLDGEDYSFAPAGVRDAKSDRGPVKAGTASVFFELNVWMQKTLKAADGRAEKEKAPNLSDGGYRHPSFEKLMSQVQGGLTAEKLGQTFENAGNQAPANLEARAQAARELAASGYGGAAHWKINSNGKYADANGNLTLLVRANGADGKIEETPVLIKKAAGGGYDLAAAVEPVTKLLMSGNVVAARAQAYQTAASASPSDVVAEISNKPVTVLSGPGIMGLAGTAKLTNVVAAPLPTDQAVAATQTRLAKAVAAETQAVDQTCAGKPDCAPTGTVQRPAVQGPKNDPIPANVGCAINLDAPQWQKDLLANASDAPPAWMKERPHYFVKGEATYGSAVGCLRSDNRALLETARERSLNMLQSLASCRAPGGPSPQVTDFGIFTLKTGGKVACARAEVKTGS
jgi:hypothetical protein